MWTTVASVGPRSLRWRRLRLRGRASAQAGSFPDRPIKFVVPYGPGGTVDPTARTLAARASEILGQPVVVENKPGAAGSIGTDFVVRAPADGYTVLVHTNIVASEPPLKPTLSYNFLKDMTPLVTIDETPFVVLVHPSLPVNSVKELVDYAKEQSGQAQLRRVGRRVVRSSARRAVQARDGHQDGIRSLYRRRRHVARTADQRDPGRIRHASRFHRHDPGRKDRASWPSEAPSAGFSCRTCRR